MIRKCEVGIIGTPYVTDYKVFKKELDDVCAKEGYTITKIISGGGKRGIDALASKYALEFDIPHVQYKRDKMVFGIGEKLQKNSFILQQADTVIAFWNGRSRNMRDTLKKAGELGVDLQLYGFKFYP